MKKSVSLNVSRTLMFAYRAQAAAVTARLAERGYPDFPFAFASVLWLVDPQGTRSTALAARGGVTKQAMSQQVKLMEQRGYLQQTPDATDTRAKLVQLTELGKAVRQASEEIREELNREAAKALGVGSLRKLQADLETIIGVFDQGAK